MNLGLCKHVHMYAQARTHAKNVHTIHTCEKGQGHLWLHRKLEVSLGYTEPVPNNIKMMCFYSVILASKSITWEVFLELQKEILLHPGRQCCLPLIAWNAESMLHKLAWVVLGWQNFRVECTWQKMTAMPDWPRVAWYFVLLFSGTSDNWLVCKNMAFANICNLSTPIGLFISHTYHL